MSSGVSMGSGFRLGALSTFFPLTWLRRGLTPLAVSPGALRSKCMPGLFLWFMT